MTSPIRHPVVLWAQREDIIYLTIDLHDAENAEITLTPSSIDFANTTDGDKYAFHLDFFKPIKADGYKKSATGRKTLLVLDKEEPAWWPRLTEKSGKLNFLKTDFDHWKDEDDSEDEQSAFPGMDFSQMGGMPGMGGMGGMGGMPDMSSLASMMGGAGGMGGLDGMMGGGPDDDDSDDGEHDESK
ncbi:p23 chaperone protein wos2 [Coemansia interrupta]|uniref:P23 chaperone protein wos2 n=1 Tax=Coemansia interrupta TaxID=1126814 RepID=A0A9W8HKD7_9FUNG|nr:p23 chaperone protein wos2 [Coemansia interrupta]